MKFELSTSCKRILTVAVLLLLFIDEGLARVGGGQSYGGGGNGGGGGDGDGGALIWLLFELIRLLVYLTIEYPIIGIPLDLVVIGGVVFFFMRPRGLQTDMISVVSRPQVGLDKGSAGSRGGLNQLRRFDPNFSEIVFTDFCYTLYAKAHNARSRGANGLDLFSPYLSSAARNSLLQRNPAKLEEVKGVIVGAMQIVEVSGLESPMVRISVTFETNYTEKLKANGKAPETTYYVHERWDFERLRDVLSPTPSEATALHCPRCGAALQKDTAGACAFCSTKIEGGEFQWYVRNILLLSREARGPLLTSDVPEVGTDLPTVMQPGFATVRSEFEKNHPEFSWAQFNERARLIFNELQAAWSSLNWERARPHETDNIFQMHQYWIEAYKSQALRNIVDNCVITATQPVKIMEDAFYNAITLRIWAQGYDYTVSANGDLVCGSKTNLRRWSEYWTFIRHRNAKPLPARADLNCPNCGAPLKVNMTGICEFCGGKVTSGEFDWVLSRIEQDESYTG